MGGPPEEEPVQFYKAAPPTWLAQIHNSSDLGYQGFHPPRPGQEEDLLIEKFVKEGFTSGSNVSVETFSALGSVKEAINDYNLLHNLEELVSRVFVRRAERWRNVPPSSFKIPGRATFNDSRRAAWVCDLANPDIPLQKLGRSVPSGFKGNDLLDMLQTNNVTIPRAVWYIRVLGGNESQGMRNRLNYNPAQPSIEWAGTLVGCMKRLLADIALPSPPRPGLNMKQVFKNNFGDVEFREQWITRCAYFLDLLLACFCEELVDHFTFLSWLCHQMGPGFTTLPQLSFVCRLAEEYVEGLGRYRPFAVCLLNDCLFRLDELEDNAHAGCIASTRSSLGGLISQIFAAHPEHFICPKIWRRHHSLLARIILHGVTSKSHLHDTDSLSAMFQDISTRNSSLLLLSLPPKTKTEARSIFDDLVILNSVCQDVEPGSIDFFRVQDNFLEKLSLLLTWSTSPSQFGDHRIYVAGTLLFALLNGQASGGPDLTTVSSDTMQDGLFHWLEQCTADVENYNETRVAHLFGELIRKEVFSYARYLQRLIARSEILAITQANCSRHADFLRNIPLIHPDSTWSRQRKIVLYGYRARSTPESDMEDALRLEIAKLIPYFFSGGGNEHPVQVASLTTGSTMLLQATVFEQTNILRACVLPAVKCTLLNSPNPSSNQLSAYAILFELIVSVKSFANLYDTIRLVLQNSTSQPLVAQALDMIIRFADIWTSMDANQSLADALSRGISSWGPNSVDLRPCIRLISRLQWNSFLSEDASTIITSYQRSLIQTLRPLIINASPLPPRLPSVLMLARDTEVEAASLLANALWEQYKSSPNFAWVIWDNVFASVRQIPVLFEDSQEQWECAMKYADFLAVVHDRSPGDFEEQIQLWLAGTGLLELKALASDVWNSFVVVLMQLLKVRVLEAQTVIKGILCPMWHLAGDSSFRGTREITGMLCASIKLASFVLLRSDDDATLQCVETYQRVIAESNAALRGEIFRLLVDAIPQLATLEHDLNLGCEIRNRVSLFRHTLSQDPQIRLVAMRDPDTVRDAFVSAIEIATLPKVKEAVANAGKLVFGEPHQGERSSLRSSITCLSLSLVDQSTRKPPLGSPLQFARRAVLKQLSLYEYNAALPDDTDDPRFEAFVASFFDCGSTEETDLLAGVVKGAVGVLRPKFVSAGMQKLTAAIHEIDLNSNSTSIARSFTRVAGDVLRMLCRVTKPWSLSDFVDIQPSGTLVQEDHIRELVPRFIAILGRISSFSSVPHDAEEMMEHRAAIQIATLMARILHFDLAFVSSWSPSIKLQAGLLQDSLLHSIIKAGSREQCDPRFFELLFDTLGYLIDELPLSEAQSLNYSSSIRHEMKADFNAMPSQHQHQIMKMGSFAKLDSYIGGLLAMTESGTAGDGSSDGEAISATPWELLDFSESQSILLDSGELRNAASIGIENFSTHLTADKIIDLPGNVRQAGSVASFQDDMYRSSLYERDWRESRLENAQAGASGTQFRVLERADDKEPDRPSQTSQHSASAGSPSPSNVSRSTGFTSQGSWKASPTAATHPSVSESVDGDISSDIPAQRGKRKASSQSQAETGPAKRGRGSKGTGARSKRKS